MNIELKVIGKPPYKQSPADSSERKNQQIYREALVKEAHEHCSQPISQNLKIDIRYTRANGRADSMNIIGGVADCLQGIVYINDKQIVEVHYSENKGTRDEYLVKISS